MRLGRAPRGRQGKNGSYALIRSAHGESGAAVTLLPLRVALTGASGYTGGRLLAALRERGDDVAVLVRPRSLSESLRTRATSVVEGDLADAAAVDRLVAGRDAVVHVAAVYRNGRAPGRVLPRGERPRHRAPAGGRGTPRRAPLRPHLDRRRPRPRRAPAGGRDRATRPRRRLPGDESRGGDAGARLPPAPGRAGDGGAPGRHLRTR
jgi:hypothetical protein